MQVCSTTFLCHVLTFGCQLPYYAHVHVKRIILAFEIFHFVELKPSDPPRRGLMTYMSCTWHKFAYMHAQSLAARVRVIVIIVRVCIGLDLKSSLFINRQSARTLNKVSFRVGSARAAYIVRGNIFPQLLCSTCVSPQYVLSWNTAAVFGLVLQLVIILSLIDGIQRRIANLVGHDLASSSEPLSLRCSVASLSLFYRYYNGRC